MRILRFLGCLATALAGAELLVRLVMNPLLDYSSLMRPGPYCIDQQTGVLTTACPGRLLMMRVSGESVYEPTRLDRYGNRGPFRNTGRAGATTRVAIVGGQSQAFGFGLRDDATYAAVAARETCVPVEIQTFAHLGIPNEESWAIAARTMFVETPPDLIILAIYWREANPDIDGRLSEVNENLRRFAVLDGQSYQSPPPFEFTRPSALAARVVDKWVTATTVTRQALGHVDTSGLPLSRPGLAGAIKAYAARAAAMETPFSVLFLPWAGDTEDDAVRAQVPGVRSIDSHTPVWRKKPANGFFPDGHYREPVAGIIGSMVAREICDVMSDRTPRPARAVSTP